MAAALLLPAAFVFSLAADLPQVIVLATLGLALSLAIPRPIPYHHRAVIYGVLGATVLTVIFDLIWPLDDARSMFLTSVLAGNLTVPMLVYLGVLATFFSSGPYQLGIAIASALLTTMFCGDFYGGSISNERFLFGASWLNQFQVVFAALAVYEVAMFLLAMQLVYVPGRNRLAAMAWTRQTLISCTLALAIMTGYGTMQLMQRYEGRLRDLEAFVLHVGLHRFIHQGNVVFRKEIDLYRTVNLPGGNERRIVVRAVSQVPPGYLRGRIYTHYRKGLWQSADTSFVRLSSRYGQGVLAVNTFFAGLEEPAPGPTTIQFYTATNASEVLLVPGQAGRFELVADQLNVSRYGMFGAEKWKLSGGYTVSVPNADFESAYAGPAPPNPGELLDLPPELLPALQTRLRQAVPALATPTQDAPPSATAIVAALVHDFAVQFRYQFPPPIPPPGEDPVMHFLRSSQTGHCELFASGTVLMLRAAGIPARYVTGFICAEQHPSGEYYVARMSDAHAWVEAWLPDQQRWVLVETTPPTDLPDGAAQWHWLESWLDRLRALLQRIFSDLQRGYFAEAIITGIKGAAAMFRDLLWHPWRGLGAALLALAIGIFMARRRRHQARHSLTGEALRLHHAFAKLERRVARATRLPRPGATPVGTWARQAAPRLANQAKFLTLVTHYETLRFREHPPSRDEAAPLLRQLQEFTPILPEKSPPRPTPPQPGRSNAARPNLNHS